MSEKQLSSAFFSLEKSLMYFSRLFHFRNSLQLEHSHKLHVILSTLGISGLQANAYLWMIKTIVLHRRQKVTESDQLAELNVLCYKEGMDGWSSGQVRWPFCWTWKKFWKVDLLAHFSCKIEPINFHYIGIKSYLWQLQIRKDLTYHQGFCLVQCN